MSNGEEIIDYAHSLFNVAGVTIDTATGDTIIVLGLVTTPERDLDDFVCEDNESIMRGFIRHAKDREDELLKFIRGKKFNAELVGKLGYSPSGKPNLKHLAVAAGLGKQGKNTLVINNDYGPWLRFMAVRTNAPVTSTGPGIYIKEQNPDCVNCQKCVDSCPVGILQPYLLLETDRCLAAISGERRGELAICDMCVVVCPVGVRESRVS